MRVVLCQTKNGLPSLLALSMKSLEALTSTSSKVVMSYFAFSERQVVHVRHVRHVRERRQRALHR